MKKRNYRIVFNKKTKSLQIAMQGLVFLHYGKTADQRPYVFVGAVLAGSEEEALILYRQNHAKELAKMEAEYDCKPGNNSQ